jgi:hypothetical protein
MGQFQAPGQTHSFGGGLAETALHPVYLILLLIVIALILTVPRKYMLAPFVMGMFLIPLGEQVYALGVHWLVGRIIVLFSLARVAMLTSDNKSSLGWCARNSIDRPFVGCVICQAVAFVLLYSDSGALINQFGFLIDFLGGYFILRVMIQDEKDVYLALKCLALITVILGIGMAWEQLTAVNIFGVLGGTRSVPDIREGTVRSQGSFQHSLTAGTFAATLVPLFFILWRNGKAKLAAAMGLIGCTTMTVCSHGSTPLLGYVSGLVAVCMFPLRRKMRAVRRCALAGLVLLHLVMKAPVWFLIARIDLTGGSSGYHRAELVDGFIRHFSDWWLLGTKDVGSWGWDMWDTQNQFVNIGETGGLLAFVLFITVIVRCYSRIGIAGKEVVGHKQEEWLLWFLGSAMLAHLVVFFGVTYFDQSRIAWLILLVAIPVMTQPRIEGNELMGASSASAELSENTLEPAWFSYDG